MSTDLISMVSILQNRNLFQLIKNAQIDIQAQSFRVVAKLHRSSDHQPGGILTLAVGHPALERIQGIVMLINLPISKNNAFSKPL